MERMAGNKTVKSAFNNYARIKPIKVAEYVIFASYVYSLISKIK
jgi:hypothetical protein